MRQVSVKADITASAYIQIEKAMKTELHRTLSESQPPAEMATVDAIAEKWATLIYRRTQLWANEKGEATSCVKEAITEATAALSAEVERLREELHRQRNICIHHTDAQLVGIVGNCPVCAQAALELARKENGELKKLIKHAYIHSGYKDCGFLQMTTEQKLIFVDILESSDMKSCSETLRKNISKPSDAAKGRGV